MKLVFMCIEVFLVMLYENIRLFQRTSLQMPKDRERIMCKLKIKRPITHYVIHKDAKCTVSHRLMHCVHRLAWGK
jgi:Rps23 Pro-64 3,4-dihydroxylase Tpa1-like proline 4-hydroxylase